MDFKQIELGLRQSLLFQELFEITESGNYARFESEAKRQHFIPQFLLRGFATKRDPERIIQLDVRSGGNRQVKISEAASRRNFYAFLDEEGNRSNQIEGFLSFVESHAAPALARLVEKPQLLGDADRATLAFFIALLDQRTPGATARSGKTANSAMRLLFAAEFSDTEKFAERYGQVFPTAVGEQAKTPAEIEKFRLELLASLREGRVSFGNSHAVALQMGLRLAGQHCYLIYGMSWTVLRCPGGFVTSDRGLAIHDPDPLYPWSSQAMLSSTKAETTIPLSADICLLLQIGDQPLAVREIDQAVADEINLRTYGWANEYLFGGNQETLARLRRRAKDRPGDIVRPKPFHHVMLLDADPTDPSLAKSNHAKGRPPYIDVQGVPHDYIVFRHDENPTDAAMMSKKIKERARRAHGIPEGEELHGGEQIVTYTLDQIGDGGWLPGEIHREWSEFVAWTEQQTKEHGEADTDT